MRPSLSMRLVVAKIIRKHTCRLNESKNPYLRSITHIHTHIYRTLHFYNLIWAVCHLFPQRWRTLTYSVSGDHWPGEQRDMLKTTYATCSHKGGGRLHIQSRETIGQENNVTCLKLRTRVNFSPAFGATYKTRIFYKYVVFKHPFSLLPNFFAAATQSLQCESTGVKSNNMDGPRRH